MRIAALYDVHGNAPALEAVLADVRRAGVDLVVLGGDVALGPLPRETIALLRTLDDVRFVRGNCDRALVEMLDGAHEPESGHLAEDWVVERLSGEDRDFLAGFEETVSVDVDGLGSTIFCHGSPRSDMEILTRMTSEERLERVLAGVGAGTVVCGHTHSQFDRPGRVRVVNAGSVGMPYEKRPGAYWALLGPDVELRRTAYDLEQAAAQIRASGWPPSEEWIRDNLLRVPSAEEASAQFEQMALDSEEQAGRPES